MNQPPGNDDSGLIRAARAGDRDAFGLLVERYRDVVWRTVRRTLGSTADAEDAVQEVFIRALVGLDRFDLRYPFAPWILRIAANYCIDRLRRRKTDRTRLWSDLSESEERRVLERMSTLPHAGEGEHDRGRYLEVARGLLERLPAKRRMAFVLREIEGRDYAEVAAALGVPETTARVRVWRARHELHREFRKLEKKGEG
jgi:RNA polymerase sigma-70 factor (ECF subfamily)